MSKSPPTTPPTYIAATDNIFSRNHLSYVVSTQENLRSYMSEALGIDNAFLGRFSVHDLTSALEHTLHCRPAEVPTEVYLKAQRLWIIHKLLIRIGFRDQVHLLASCDSTHQGHPSVAKEEDDDIKGRNLQHIESELISMLQGAANHLQSLAYRSQKQRIPLVDTFDEMMRHLHELRERHAEALMEDKRRLVDQRCRAIRWVAWVYMQDGGEAWLKRATQTELVDAYGGHIA